MIKKLVMALLPALLVATPSSCSADKPPSPARSETAPPAVNPPALNVPPGMEYSDAGVTLYFFGEAISPDRNTATGKSIKVTGKVIALDSKGNRNTIAAEPGEGCRKTGDHQMICESPTKQVVSVPPHFIGTAIFTFEFQTSLPGWKMHCYASFDPKGRALRFDEETSDPTSANDPVADATCSWP